MTIFLGSKRIGQLPGLQCSSDRTGGFIQHRDERLLRFGYHQPRRRIERCNGRLRGSSVGRLPLLLHGHDPGHVPHHHRQDVQERCGRSCQLRRFGRPTVDCTGNLCDDDFEARAGRPGVRPTVWGGQNRATAKLACKNNPLLHRVSHQCSCVVNLLIAMLHIS